MNRTVQFTIGVIAVVVALGAGFYGRNLYLKEVSTYQVPVPINAIPAYAILDADMFQMREMPRTMASLPYYQSTQDLEGKISTVSLPAELPVAQANAQTHGKYFQGEADPHLFPRSRSFYSL